MPESLRQQIREFVQRYHTRGLLRLLLAPLTSLVVTPRRYWQLLQVCRRAGSRCWSPQQDFDAYKGLLAYAYHTQALVRSRHGQSGHCPYLGAGHYPLSAWWHITWPSLYLYWKSSALVPLVAILLWWFSWLVWWPQSSLTPLVLLLLVGSSSLYGQALLRQNYNVLGWSFWPLGLWALLNQHHQLAAGCWLGASFFSFTAAFTAGLVCALFSCAQFSLGPLLSVVPAGIKLLTHWWPNLVQGNVIARMSATAKAIGLRSTQAPLAPKHPLGTRAQYILFLQVFFALTCWQSTVGALHGVCLLIFLTNFKKRFADEQSMDLMLLSSAVAITLQDFHWPQFLGLWILSCPIPLLDLRTRGWSLLDTVPRMDLLDFRRIEQALDQFLSPIPDHARILMTFPDPLGDYSKIFNGQHMLKEPLNYQAALRRLHLSPDFWYVFENNHQGGTQLWGCTPAEAVHNAQAIQARFVITYTEEAQPREASMEEAGFQLLGRFAWSDWSQFCPYLRRPNWWLWAVPI